MTGFKKPTTLLQDAKVAVRQKLGLHVPADSRRAFSDTMEVLSPGTVIAYKRRGSGSNYPSDATRASIVAAANKARRIMRKANNELAAVALLRQKESALFQRVLDVHFRLIAGDTAGGMLTDNIVNKAFSPREVMKRDRRWVIEKIRQGMLSISFHLNTGVYLIDIDKDNRDISSGQTSVPGTEDALGYVTGEKIGIDSTTWRSKGQRWGSGITCGFKHGEIHVSFDKHQNFSDISFAQTIIHEATHKYLNTNDHAYADQAHYSTLSLAQTLDNADSFAWAAVSLYCGSAKMTTTNSADYNQCAKP